MNTYKGPTFFWTKKEGAIVLQGLQEGLSAAEIARKLKTRTRNAVIGYINREKLNDLWVNKITKGGRKPTENKAAPLWIRRQRHARKMTHAVKPPTPPKPPRPKAELLVDSPNPKTIFELKNFECRAVLGDTNAEKTMYCGNPVEGFGSWCPYHRSIYFAPMTAPREKKDEGNETKSRNNKFFQFARR